MSWISGPQVGAILAAHDNTIEIAKVECVACGRMEKERADHSLTDKEIKDSCFPQWKVKGVNGAKSTKCPNCR